MSINVRKSYSYSFVLDEPELRRIHKVLTEQMAQAANNSNATTTFSLKLKNEMAFEKTSLDDVLSESNGNEKEIQELEILIEDRSQGNEISLQLFKDELLSILYQVRGSDRSWVTITQSVLDERIRNIRQPFVASGGARVALQFVAIMIPVIILSLFLALFGGNPFTGAPPPGNTAIPIRNLVVFVLIMLLLATGILSYLYFFTQHNFCWGDYVKVYQRRQSIGNFIIIIVIVGLIISIVGSIFASIFLTK